MRKTKFTFAFIMLILSLYLLFSYFFGHIIDIERSFNSIFNTSSLFGLARGIELGDIYFIDSETGYRVRELYKSTGYNMGYVYLACIVLLTLNSLRTRGKIKNSNKIVFITVRNMIYTVTIAFVLVGTLSFNLVSETYYYMGGNWVLQESMTKYVSLVDAKLSKDFFGVLIAIGGLILCEITIIGLCARYGDWSPIIPKVPKKKKAKNVQKTKIEKDKKKVKNIPNQKNVSQEHETVHEEKHIFYDGVVPHIEDKLFEDYRDEYEQEQPEPLNQNKNTTSIKTTINLKQNESNKQNKTVNQVSFTTDVKKKQDEFTGGDLFKYNKPVEIEEEEKSTFENKNSMTMFSSAFSSNQDESLQSILNDTFNSKNLFLDEHDEFFGEDEEEDTPLEEEVPDIE